MTRDGRVVEIRRPDDCAEEHFWPIVKHCEAQSLHVGPRGAVWVNGDDRLLRFTQNGVEQVDVGSQFRALAATEDGVFASRRGESGVRLIESNGHEVGMLANIGKVDRIVARPDGGLWLIVETKGPAHLGNVTSLQVLLPKQKHASRPIRVPYLVGHTFAGHFAIAPDGGLVADLSVKPDPRRNNATDMSVVQIAVDGTTRVLATIPYDRAMSFPQVGGLAVAGDGTVWFTQPDGYSIVRIDADGTRRDYHDRLPPGSTPTGITVDDDGSVWYSDRARATIGHLAPATGAVRVFGTGLSPLSRPAAPVVSGDGAVWFSETYSYHQRIARIAPDGTAREFDHFAEQYTDWLKPEVRGVSLFTHRCSSIRFQPAGLTSERIKPRERPGKHSCRRVRRNSMASRACSSITKIVGCAAHRYLATR